MKEKIIIGSDHAGFPLKEKVKRWLEKEGYAVSDLGCFSAERCDYPDYAEKVAKKVAKSRNAIGMLFCGTGVGMSIAANKIRGIRAAVVYNEFTGRMAREHNNANIICLGARTTSFNKAKEAIKAFLNAEFQGGRHARRVKKIKELERDV